MSLHSDFSIMTNFQDVFLIFNLSKMESYVKVSNEKMLVRLLCMYLLIGTLRFKFYINVLHYS